MGAQTRSSSSSSSSNSPVKAQSAAKGVGSDEGSQPLKLFILPKQTSSGARFVVLKHPADGTKKRFYFCPSNGLFELKKVDAPMHDLRSILFTRLDEDSATDTMMQRDLASPENDHRLDDGPQWPAGAADVASGYVNKAAELFVATPFDMVFILIPLLNRDEMHAKSHAGKALFQPIDDILDPYLEDDSHLRYILERGRSILEGAAARICDVVEAGDEKMFRLNKEIVFKDMLSRAQNVVRRGLPASLEDKFVKRALEKPVLSIQREDSSFSVMTESSTGDSGGSLPGACNSQSSTTTSMVSAAAKASMTTPIVSDEDEAIPDQIVHLQRLQTAWSFITSSYLPDQLRGSLTEVLSSDQCPVDFRPLETYFDHLNTLRTEAMASRSLSTFSQKRGLDDQDASEAKADKRQKQEEAERRKKAGESRGVRELKKVDVSGMKKMSAFFTKTSTTKVES